MTPARPPISSASLSNTAVPDLIRDLFPPRKMLKAPDQVRGCRVHERAASVLKISLTEIHNPLKSVSRTACPHADKTGVRR